MTDGFNTTDRLFVNVLVLESACEFIYLGSGKNLTELRRTE